MGMEYIFKTRFHRIIEKHRFQNSLMLGERGLRSLFICPFFSKCFFKLFFWEKYARLNTQIVSKLHDGINPLTHYFSLRVELAERNWASEPEKVLIV